MTDLPAAVRQLRELQEKAPQLQETYIGGAAMMEFVTKQGVSAGFVYDRDLAGLIVAAVNLVGPLIEDWERLHHLAEQRLQIMGALFGVLNNHPEITGEVVTAVAALSPDAALSGGEE